MGKLTIQEVAKVLTERNGLSQREASRFAAEMFAVILNRLQEGDSVKVKGLGTFKIIVVDSRESVSVRTGERVVIDSHSKVTFTPDAVMKELVNKPFSQFETVVLNDGIEFSDLNEQSEVAEADVDVDGEEEELKETQVQEIHEVIEQEPEVVEEKPLAIEQEPEVVEEKPLVVEEEPEVVEEEPEVVEEEPSSVEERPLIETVDDSIEPEESESDEESSPWGRWLLMALVILLIAGLAAFGGYWYGSQHQSSTKVLPDTVFVRDTVFVSELAVDSVSEAESETVEVKPVATEEKPVATEHLDPYAAKDERVRLGAYRIVGTAQEITVQAGQTFYSICRAYLGPDMECYIEVYNDLPRDPQIKAGQVLKIPKLEWKKRRK